VQRGQLRAGIKAQLVRQPLPQLTVAVQRLARPPGPVQGRQLRGPQPLPQRMPRHQPGQLAGQPGVVAELEARLGLLLQRDEPFLL